MRVPVPAPTLRSLLCLSLALLACGDDDAPERDAGSPVDAGRPRDVGPRPDAGGPTPPPAQVAQILAYEGQQRYVTVLSAFGVDVADAEVFAEGPDSPLTVVEYTCTSARCAVLLTVADHIENLGFPVPAPIDSVSAFIRLRKADGQQWRGLVKIQPLDNIENDSLEVLRVSGISLASSARTIAGSTLRASALSDPVRWIVFGDAEIRGDIDVSALGREAGAGGGSGGEAGGDAMGAGGGGGADDGGGGGGGGNATPGAAGEDADGVVGEGGAGGDAVPEACITDFEDDECGGGGGGGAAGPGGGGGGTLVIIALGALDLSGASFTSRGSDGTDGGGGGAGGHVMIAAHSWTAPETLGVEPGEGAPAAGAGGRGGDGADGILRVDVPGEQARGNLVGVVVDVAELPWLHREETATLTGAAAPGARVEVFELDGPRRASVTAGDDGRFAVDVDLEVGINRLTVQATSDAGTLRCWTGTSITFDRGAASPTPVPVGAVIDLAYLPVGE